MPQLVRADPRVRACNRVPTVVHAPGGGVMAPDKTVLVVEDDEIVREGLASVLREAGCRVDTAGSGTQALAYLKARPAPDLVLLDMLMPDGDGWEFMRVRARDPALSAVPILILT